MKREPLCLQSGEVPAWLAGELTPPEEQSFQSHLADCASCQAEVAATRRVLEQLRRIPMTPPSPRLGERVLAQVQVVKGGAEWETTTMKRCAPLLALAAAVAVLCGMAWLLPATPPKLVTNPAGTPLNLPPEVTAPDEPPGGNPSLQQALAWLTTAQEPDGSWNASRWGGDRRFQPALTALPLLALVEAAPNSLEGEQTEALARAQAHLCHLQDARGAFGTTFQGAPYNQGIATLALLHAYRRQPERELKRVLDSALELIVARQTPSGGWGYLYTPLPNLSVSLWHIECLRLAAELGWETVRAPLQHSLAWQAEQKRRLAADVEANEPANSPSREVISEQSAERDLDYCRTYFLAVNLRRGTDENSRSQLASLQATLRAAQVHEGDFSGSWQPDDRWSKVGGRLYTTALAALAMR